MVTGSTQTKHKHYYSCLNIYPIEMAGARKPKWIPTGLSERGNKRKADHITDQLKQLFNRDGTLIDKYAFCCNPIERIAADYPDLPQITLTSLRNQFGGKILRENIALETARQQAKTMLLIDGEKPETIRKMRFCDYLVLWLERTAPNLDIGTYGSYRGVLHGRTYRFFNSLGVSVEDLLPGHIEEFYRFLSFKEKLSQNSILHYHCNIRKALQQLYIKQIIPNNPADLIVNRPKRTVYQANFWNEEQVNEYLQIVKGTKMHLPVLFAAFYGLRRSEALGVKDTAINYNRKIFTVSHVVTLANVGRGVELVQKDRTKSQTSLRSLPLVEDAFTAILESNDRQAYYEKKLGSLYYTGDRHYLCKDETGHLLHPDYVTTKHKELLKKHNLPLIRFHDLRHSCASILLSKGISLDKIKEWLGHSDINMTMRYAHLNVSTAKNEMASIMEDLLELK